MKNISKNLTWKIMVLGLVLAVAVTNLCSFIRDGRRLDQLRNNVLRLHILAESDSPRDQRLKLAVRDAVLARSDEIFGNAGCFDSAVDTVSENLTLIEETAEEVLAENGCYAPVSAEITNMYFDSRTYGDITMPEGDYTALRISIGSAQGHNWWCVMYPPLCIPAACESGITDDKETEDRFFDNSQQDIIMNPEKYRVRFALWDKIMSMADKDVVQNDKKSADA